jgi:hypothetical protein
MLKPSPKVKPTPVDEANGFVLYTGPSLINGAPIVVIATGFNSGSANSKTGGMIQTYILSREDEPHLLIKDGRDESICGDCVHRGNDTRGRSCYVQVGQGPLNVYRAWGRNRYPVMPDELYTRFANRRVRFGAYGDPAAVPWEVWNKISTHADSCTGYTHQWKHAAKRYAEWCMASVDSLEEAKLAQNGGYRTFRVGLEGQVGRQKGEALCPASEEAGKKLQCFECMACDGLQSNRKGSIFIPVHGNASHRSNAKKIPIALV